ncbi:OmpA family protein [Hyalangium sp.]|uniref:OmpA family protein n=1 Tax=Hyalangium sp. TaxID=2028555 RepID=UPI002D2E4146|nr:OmpA family protein [Hyalangium sp.]HYH97927.1 OmpA family protein [Hyalangium sp.]
MNTHIHTVPEPLRTQEGNPGWRLSGVVSLPSSRVLRAALLAACCVLGMACDQSLPEPSPTPNKEAALTGADGDVTILAPDTILNRYAVLAADASAGATSIQVTAASDLNDPNFGPLEAGDVVFIIQMQGASIDTSDSPSYGTVTNLNSAGLYEFASVLRVQGNTLFLACSGLKNSYTQAGRTQVVRVPQLSNLTIESGGTVMAKPWDGQSGGVVVLHVAGITSMSGPIDVTGQGFRPGVRDNSSASATTQVTLYRSNDETLGAEKGESIAGHGTDYAALGGRFGRGAPANGGGGGNSHNAGGGGGANGNSGNVWRGQGVMTSTVVGAAAWALDPAYGANGNARTNDSGGGRGGYTLSAANADALTAGPGNAAWAGNNRAAVGGLGGHPVDNDPTSRLFLGGGGGAGDGNNNASGDGGSGGGLVYLISTTVNGSGAIFANGRSAQSTTNPHNDGVGGGGGGGTVVVLSSDVSGISVYANGGLGGRQLITTLEAQGPGGGGGGGYIALSSNTVTTSVVGGDSGSTTSTALTEFPVNGATLGAAGQVVDAPTPLPPALACVPVDLAITLSNPETTTRPDTTGRYTVTVTNAGPLTATNAPVSVPLPPNASGATWTCTAAGGATCQTPGGAGGIATNVTVPPGGTVTFVLDVDVSLSAVDTFTVTATVSAPNASSDVDPTNNTATDTNRILAEADLSVTLEDSPDPVLQGSPLTYSVEVFNDGPDFSSVVTVTLQIDVGSTFSSANGQGWTCTRNGQDVTCTTETLPPGSAPPITIGVIPTIEGGTLLARVFVNASTDTVGENNSDEETTTVIAANDPPVNTVPGTQTLPVDTTLVFSTAVGNAISVADPDAGPETVQVTLTVTHGTLTLSGTAGLTFSTGDGTGEATMSFTGTLAAINAALQGLSFTPDVGYLGDASFTITSDDLGHTGVGGPKSDTDTFTITVIDFNPPPTAVDDTATVVEDSQENSIDVLANDSTAPNTGETLTIVEVTQGNHGGTVTITEGGTRVVYTPAPGFWGTETFTYTISDGNSTSTATVTVTVEEKVVPRVVGRGCSASGGGLPSAGWMLVALAGLMLVRPRGARLGSRGLSALLGLGAVAVLAASPSAQAQSSSTAIDVQQFKPAPGRSGVLGLHGAGFPGHLSWTAGLYIHYAHEPLVVINSRNEDLLQHLVKNQMGFDLVGAIGVGDHFELGASVPIALQHGEFNQQTTGAAEQTWKGGLGDLRLIPKAEIYENERLRLAAVAPVVLPTGGHTDLRGHKGVGVQPRVVGDYTLEGGTRLLANVGVNLRSRQELLNLSVGHELAYGIGAAIPFQLQGHQLTGMASLAGALGLGATGGTNEEEIPLELQAGLQYHFNKNVVGTLGLGRGMTLGYGMPSFRVLGGVAWITEDAPRGRARDADGDGLNNADDKCSDEPEDEDDFQDEDGCPDPDNDQDGILDVNDKCPNEPEDKDGFQDEDGCPDPDNDRDGLLDPGDKCPLQPEDKDGFQDEDGCPDPDNDQDGILDSGDKCPLQLEDKDGFQDEDGCPDPDNDRDGVNDADDQCPAEQETINGVDDADGCADQGEAQVEIQGRSIKILQKVYFATNKDVVLARSFPLLQQVGQVLRANSQLTKVRVEGHTDSRADDAFNMDLSQRRAGNVRKYLVEQAGIAPERLEAVGYGESQPVDTNKTEQGLENNRRVVFTILEIDGKPVAQ